MDLRVVTGLLVASLLVNGILVYNVHALGDDVSELRQTVARTDRHLLTLDGRLGETLTTVAGIDARTRVVADSEAAVHWEGGDCDGVPVRFTGTFTRLPREADVFLVPRVMEDQTGEVPEGTRLEPVRAELTGALAAEAIVTLPEGRRYAWEWLVRAPAEDARWHGGWLTHALSWDPGGTSVAGTSSGDASGTAPEAGRIEVVGVSGSPNSRACERVANGVVVLSDADGGTHRVSLTHAGDDEWEARVPDDVPARHFEHVEWTLKGGRTIVLGR